MDKIYLTSCYSTAQDGTHREIYSERNSTLELAKKVSKGIKCSWSVIESTVDNGMTWDIVK